MTIKNYKAVNTFIDEKRIGESVVLNVVKDKKITAFDEATFARLRNVNLKNGMIEVMVKSTVLPDAPDFARGFIGVAFRINETNDAFESFYIRPTNGRSNEQLRRNHSTQYFSYPDYKFDRLRNESPGEYESYADMEIEEWIALKIIIEDSYAALFVNHSEQPVLIVNDLKHGITSGGVGLWVEVGTDGFFKDLIISKKD